MDSNICAFVYFQNFNMVFPHFIQLYKCYRKMAINIFISQLYILLIFLLKPYKFFFLK